MFASTNSNFVSSEVIRMMASSEDLRARMSQDPAKALAALGIPLDGVDVPQSVVIPSVEELQSTGTNDTGGFEPAKWLGFLT